MQTDFFTFYFPVNFPTKMSGKLTHKIIIKDDFVRTDGTCALYVQTFLDGKMKRLPLNISIEPKRFDKMNQRIKGKSQLAKDYNLVISKTLKPTPINFNFLKVRLLILLKIFFI